MATYTYNLAAADIAGAKNLSAIAAATYVSGDNVVVTNTTNAVAGGTLTLDDGRTPASIKYVGGTAVDNVEVVTLSTAKATTTVNGGGGADVIKLTSGTSTVVYDANDVVTWVAGTTTIDASATSSAVNWDLSAAANAAGGIAYGAGSAIAASKILGVIGTQYADTLKGATAGAVTLNGGNGADKLYGQSAGTTKFIYDANDALVDGTATVNDTLDASANTSGIQLYLDGNTVFKGIDTVTGGSGSDDIRGDALTKSIGGGKGVDYIWGGLNGTAQTLNGGAGNDQIYFGTGEGLGNKTIIAYDTAGIAAGTATTTDAAGDVVNLYNISAYDLVGVGKMTTGAADGTVSNGTASVILKDAAGQANATRHFVSSEGWAFDVVFGQTGVAGTLTGTAGVIDNLVGGGVALGTSNFDGKGGNDNIYTATLGNSNIVYHAGDTIFTTSAGNNTLTAATATAGVQMYVDNMVNTGAGTALSASWNLVGSAQNDEIRGQSDVTAQTLNGGAGNDALWGGAGSTNLDTLIGGAGADTYYYGLDEGNDVIQAGTSTATGNSLDTLNFYNVTDVSKLSGTLVPGGDMTINIAGTGVTTLTLQGWGASSGLNKLTNVVVNGTAYTLSADASNNAVFTAK